MEWIYKELSKNFAELLVKKQGVKCQCGRELIYRGNAEYWCDDLMCMYLYVIDQDHHIVLNGKVSKCKETRCHL